MSLTLPVLGDRGAFFEHWLRSIYFSRRLSKVSTEIEGPIPVVGFPVLFNARKGELFTVLRMPLSALSWRDEEGKPWPFPLRRRPSRAKAPKPPAFVELRAEPPEPGELPFSFDEPVLSRMLGVQDELIGELSEMLGGLDAVSPEAMIRIIIGLIEGASEESAVQLEQQLVSSENRGLTLIHALTDAVSASLIAAGVRVWPIGIVYDGASLRATTYLQQDLQALIRKTVPAVRGSVLRAYLERDRLPVERRAHLGCRDGRPLTPDQRDAVERFGGSSLTVVQGPPGTGKTELILALCAGALIEQTATFGRGTPPRCGNSRLTVVCSTNNRAVDNVIDPLSTHLTEEHLPIALRVGSRIAVADITLPMLQRTRDWLEAAEPPAMEVYLELRRAVREAVDAVRDAERPLLKARRLQQELSQAEDQRDRLRRELDEVLRKPTRAIFSRKARKTARTKLVLARAKVEKLLDDIEKGRGVERKPLSKSLKKLSGWLSRSFVESFVALELEASVPEFDETLDVTAIASALEAMLDELDELENGLDDLDDAAASFIDPSQLEKRLEKVEASISRLRKEQIDWEELDKAVQCAVEEQEEGLFEKAIALREAWAALNRERLLVSVTAAIEELRAAPSPRKIERSDDVVYQDVLELFPIWGCTLLSLGNCFPLEAGFIDRVIIDEAGQCHAAYVVSALARAEQALVIGDVHQLEPVIEIGESEEARVLRKLNMTSKLSELEAYRVHARADNSAQTLAARAVSEVPSLRDHFRCQPEIIQVSNELCDYNLVIRTKRASLDTRVPWLRGPIMGMAVRGIQRTHLGSWRNDEELERVVDLVRGLIRAGVRAGQIATLTPYRGQHLALEEMLLRFGVPTERRLATRNAREVREQGRLFDEQRAGGVAVGTLHRFQGAERDVVVLSTVVNRRPSLAFTNDRVNLINVAVSRAKQHLIVVGNPELLRQGPVTGALIRAIPDDCWLT